MSSKWLSLEEALTKALDAAYAIDGVEQVSILRLTTAFWRTTLLPPLMYRLGTIQQWTATPLTLKTFLAAMNSKFKVLSQQVWKPIPRYKR